MSSARSIVTLAALCVAVPVFAQSPWPLFPAQRLFSIGSETSFALADLDNDGELDLVSNQPAPGIGVRFGNGLGVFSPVVPYGTATGFAKTVRAGDLENDGDIDVVYSRSASADFAVLLNDGTGVLVAAASVGLPGSPMDIELGELDGQAGLDAAVTCGNGQVSLHFGDGLGGFGSSSVLQPGSGLGDLAIADLDADGKSDLAIVAPSSIWLYRGLGGGAFAPLAPLSDSVNGLAVADYSGDGKLDLAFSTFSNFARVWLGDGQGGFTFASQVPLGGNQAFGIAAHDVDLDGLADFAVVSFIDESVSVLRSLGGGTFAPAVVYPAAYRARGIVIGNCDRDSGADLVVGQDSSGGPLLLLGNGSGSFVSGIEFPGGGGAPGGIFRGDFDHDGFDDLGYIASSTIITRLGDGAGGFSNPISSVQVANSSDPECAKFNGDAFDDLVLGTVTLPQLTGSVRVYFGDGAGRFTAGPNLPTSFGIYQIATGDIDGDGDQDFAYVEGDTLRVQLGQGTGTFTPGPSVPGMPWSVEDLELAFVNGDALLDAIVVGSSSVLRLDGLGFGAFAPPVPVASSPNAIAGTLGDFDGDGDMDLATSYYQSGPMRLWSNDGLGNFTFLRALAGECGRLLLSDFDRDGRLELAGTVANQDFVQVWSGSANGPIEPAQAFRTGQQPFDLVELQSRAGTPMDLAVLADSVFVFEGLAPPPPTGLVYCTAKLNALGCLPNISATGSSSASATSGFVIRADLVRNRKSGLLMYGISGRAATPFSGGILCLQAPIKRAGPLNSGGTPLPTQDCSGAYVIDMNAFAAGSGPSIPLPLLREPGVSVDCQFWGRDPGFPPPNATTLSDALEYTVAP